MIASTGPTSIPRTRAPMRRRLVVSGMALATVTCVVSAGSSAPATADVSGMPPGSALSKAAQADQGATKVTPTVTVLSVLNATTLANAVTTTLTTPLQALSANLTTSLNNGLVATGLQANSPATQQQRPAGGTYPTCGQQGWNSTDCYGPVTPAVTGGSLVTVSTGAFQGYATGDKFGYVAGARVADPVISLLGASIGDLGVSTATASCDTTPTCTAAHGLTGGSLFGGTLTYAVANGTLLAQVGSQTIGTTAVPVVNGVTATVGGNLLTLNISIPLGQLLGLLGTSLTALGPLLGGTGGVASDNNSLVTLVVGIGPGNVTSGTSTQSSAWGIDVAVDLVGTISLKIGALATVSIAIGRTDPTKADLTDLKLAYSQASAGSVPPSFVPPALI